MIPFLDPALVKRINDAQTLDELKGALIGALSLFADDISALQSEVARVQERLDFDTK